MFQKKRGMTLIELIVVITVLGVLAAIIVPNIGSIQKQAEVTAVASNMKSLQTGVDMYVLDSYGQLPVVGDQPTEMNPKAIELKKLNPKYIRDLPENQRTKYWVDYTGKVWASTVDAPTNVRNNNGVVTWEKTEGADEYRVYKAQGYNGVVGAASQENGSLTLVGTTEGNSYNTEDPNSDYVVSAVDEGGNESVAVDGSYKGYITLIDLADCTTVPTEYLPLCHGLEKIDYYKGEFSMSMTTAYNLMGMSVSSNIDSSGVINGSRIKIEGISTSNMDGMISATDYQAIGIDNTIYYYSSMIGSWSELPASSVQLTEEETIMKFQSSSEGLLGSFGDVPVEIIGEQVVNGEDTTLYRISLTSQNFDRFLSEEDIIVAEDIQSVTVDSYIMDMYVNNNEDIVRTVFINDIHAVLSGMEVDLSTNSEINFFNIGADIPINPPVLP